MLLIPVWQPDEALLELIRSLPAGLFLRIVVVDDGSDSGQGAVLSKVSDLGSVTVLKHERNLGKGAALKTGLRWILAEGYGRASVVTADADGQHRPGDIIQVADVLAPSESAVLGVRSLGRGTPWRSRAGNEMMRLLFWPVARRMLPDTQSGLRGFPARLIPLLLAVPGERYDYETAVLARLFRQGERLVEVPITTVYASGNRGSHFRPLLDSLRVCYLLLRMMLRTEKRG